MKYPKLIAILLLININFTLGIRPFNRMSRSCYSVGSELMTQINNLEDDINRKNEEMNIKEKHINYLKNMITTKYCKEGQYYSLYFNLDHKDVMCINCHLNYYRTSDNNTCIKCPPGYYSNEGAVQCIKSETNNTNVHTLCEVGTIVGNDKFANKCDKCNKDKKEYMPYENNNHKCLICPPGSIVTSESKCIQCSKGEYEQNNECFECKKGSYTDNEGMNECKICDNKKSFSYFLDGGTNCDDSIIYTINDNINSVVTNINPHINLDTVLNPLSNVFQIGASMVYTNRNPIIASILASTYVITCASIISFTVFY